VPLLHDDLVCRDAVALAGDYIDGTLTWRRRRSYERHIASCPNCRAHLAQLQAVVASLGRVEPDALTPDAKADLIDVFRRFREEQDADGAADGGAGG
jgi:anti-sigma factor RsiW